VRNAGRTAGAGFQRIRPDGGVGNSEFERSTSCQARNGAVVQREAPPALLRVLRAHGIEAAFFAIGQKVEAEPGLANEILRGGHLLENRSYRHSHATNLYAPARLMADLVRAQQAIERHTGTTPRFFRPPLGLSNPFIFGVAGALGLKVVGWDIQRLRQTADDVDLFRWKWLRR
jgi:peptidoglycan/xylan/chitin deacetylase (PgdA/CDA1 family)